MWINPAFDSVHQRGSLLKTEKSYTIMRDALSAVAASLPAPKAQWISAIQEGDMGCIINMDKNRGKMYIHEVYI